MIFLKKQLDQLQSLLQPFRKKLIKNIIEKKFKKGVLENVIKTCQAIREKRLNILYVICIIE
jgi:hypothetical protein